MLSTLFWLAVVLVLGGTSLLTARDDWRELPTGTTEITLFPERPTGRVLAVDVGWDARPGVEGWVVLEGAEARSASDAMSWRRRVHPGWNRLVWTDVAALPAGNPVRLRFEPPPDSPWRISAPRVDAGYRLHHLTQVRGLLLALMVAMVLAVWRMMGAAARVPPRPRELRWWLAVAGIAGVALWLRGHTLGLQSLWFDEVLTAIGARDLAWVLYTPQIFGHPPLHFLVVWAIGGGSAGEWWLRLPSLVAGVATVVALAWFGRTVLGPATGLAAGLALSLLPFHVEMSQLARPYALFLLLTVLSLSAMFHAIERQRTGDWLWFSALATLTLYTHYLALQVLALQVAVAIVLLARARWRGTLPALLSFAGIGVLMLPWIPVLTRLGDAQLGRGELSAAVFRDLITTVFVPQFLGPGAGTRIGLALLVCGFLALRRHRDIALVTVLWLALPPLGLWLAQPAHFIAGRHVAFVLPVVMLLLGHGAAAVADGATRAMRGLGMFPRALPRLGAAMAAIVIVLAWCAPSAEALRYYYQTRHGGDWRTVAAVLDHVIGDDDRVAATTGALYPLRHYWSVRVEDLVAAGFPGAPDRNAGRWWIVAHGGWDRPADLAPWLDAHAVKVADLPASWSVPGVEIYRLRSPR